LRRGREMADVFAKETARVADRRQPIIRGESFDENDPLVRAHRSLFADPEQAAQRAKRPTSSVELGARSMVGRRTVEQATAAPGEVRTVAAPEEPDPELVCREMVDGVECGYIARSKAGLGAHKRVHESDDEGDE
jgi:hypothetical protein